MKDFLIISIALIVWLVSTILWLYTGNLLFSYPSGIGIGMEVGILLRDKQRVGC